MKHPIARPFLPALALLALTGMGPSAIAGEKPEDPEEAASEQSTVSPGNHLRWSTATELENFGYDVYRGESEDGPFERINADPILGAGTSDEPSSYEYVDDDIDLYTTYWYYLEAISMNGSRERFTPIFKKQAKLPRPGSDQETSPKEGEGDSDPN